MCRYKWLLIKFKKHDWDVAQNKQAAFKSSSWQQRLRINMIRLEKCFNLFVFVYDSTNNWWMIQWMFDILDGFLLKITVKAWIKSQLQNMFGERTANSLQNTLVNIVNIYHNHRIHKVCLICKITHVISCSLEP